MILHIDKGNEPFTVLPNATLRDANLSFKALGLLTYLLSLPHNWKVNYRHLATLRPSDGDSSIRVAMRELRDAGYVRMARLRNADGTMGSSEWTVRSMPFEGDDNDTTPTEPQPPPCTENPCVVEPRVENPHVVNHALRKNYSKEETKKERLTTTYAREEESNSTPEEGRSSSGSFSLEEILGIELPATNTQANWLRTYCLQYPEEAQELRGILDSSSDIKYKLRYVHGIARERKSRRDAGQPLERGTSTATPIASRPTPQHAAPPSRPAYSSHPLENLSAEEQDRIGREILEAGLRRDFPDLYPEGTEIVL